MRTDAVASQTVAAQEPPVLAPRLFWGIVLGVTFLRLLFLWLSGLELSPDEAYYWDWSRQLDYGYYSKPPMIAWLMALTTGIFGDVFWAVRLPAVFLGLGVLVGVYLATTVAFSRAAGQAATLLLLLTPAHSALSFLHTIDPPTLAFWALAMAMMAVAVRREQTEPPAPWALWLGAGGLMALALLSKQTSIALPAGIVGTFVLTPTTWRWAKRVLVGLSVPVGLALLPQLIWNARHGWIMFGHTQEHFGSETPTGIREALGSMAEFAVSQLVLVTPGTGLLIVVSGIFFALRWFREGPLLRALAIVGPVAIGSVLALSLVQRVQPNWPAPFYLASFVLVGGWLVRSGGRFWRSYWFLLAMALALPLTGLFYVIPALTTTEALAGNRRFDATIRLRQWESLAEQVQQVRASVGEDYVLCVTARQPVSLLAFYLPDQPRVYRWMPGGVIDSQHEIWSGPDEFIGGSALVVLQSPEDLAPLREHFGKVEKVGEARQVWGPHPEAKRTTYELFFAEDFRGFVR